MTNLTGHDHDMNNNLPTCNESQIEDEGHSDSDIDGSDGQMSHCLEVKDKGKDQGACFSTKACTGGIAGAIQSLQQSQGPMSGVRFGVFPGQRLSCIRLYAYWDPAFTETAIFT